jgi:RND superfamily putative drug exporter
VSRLLEATGRFAVRYRWIVALVWIVGAVFGSRLLPSLATVSNANNAQFLPASAPSQQAADLAAPFQAGNPGSTAVLVAARQDGTLTTADDNAITEAEALARNVSDVTAVRDLGPSADGRARRALVVTTASAQAGTAGATVKGIRDAFATVGRAPGLEFHLTGALAQSVDASASNAQASTNIRLFTVLFVIILLFAVYRSLLAPIATLVPAVLSLALSGGLIAKAAQAGLPVSTATQLLLPVLLLGAGADYGLFLVFRVREEVREGAEINEAIVRAMGRVGESISFSAGTVIVALCCLILASFGIYRGLGPALAIGVAVILVAALTFLPALLAIFGRALFWPSHPAPGQSVRDVWGRIAERVVQRPIPVLLAGIVLFGALSAGLIGFKMGGFASNASTAGTDSAAGSASLSAHFPPAAASSETLILRFHAPVWGNLDALGQADVSLRQGTAIKSLIGPFDASGLALTPSHVASLYAKLGPPATLPPVPPATVTTPVFRAYRAMAQLVGADGRTVQFSVVPVAGSPGSQAAIDAIPTLRTAVATAARTSRAETGGVLGQDAVAFDIEQYSTSDLLLIVPVALIAIAVLLALLLRSIVAPIYLIGTVGLSYLAALGFATIVFVRLGHADGLIFIIPILLFIFAMALGEDYNILLMSRVREEAHNRPLPEALARAVGRTGGTITSAGVILAGTFTVLGIAGNSEQARQLGFTIGFAVFLDTFFVRTLLVPSVGALLGRWNWWPSALSRRLTS